MKKEDAKKLAPIIKAYGDGKEVEWFNGHIWENGTFIGFSDKPENYRIKKESKLVPFTFEDNLLFRDKWIRYKGCFPLSKVICYGPKGLYFDDRSNWQSYQICFENYEFENGTPFGKYINE